MLSQVSINIRPKGADFGWVEIRSKHLTRS